MDTRDLLDDEIGEKLLPQIAYFKIILLTFEENMEFLQEFYNYFIKKPKPYQKILLKHLEIT